MNAKQVWFLKIPFWILIKIWFVSFDHIFFVALNASRAVARFLGARGKEHNWRPLLLSNGCWEQKKTRGLTTIRPSTFPQWHLAFSWPDVTCKLHTTQKYRSMRRTPPYRPILKFFCLWCFLVHTQILYEFHQDRGTFKGRLHTSQKYRSLGGTPPPVWFQKFLPRIFSCPYTHPVWISLRSRHF